MTTDNPLCECADPAYPACSGHCDKPAIAIAYRVDMDDRTGTATK